MHALKVDSRKIMAIVLVIAAIFAAVAITTSLFYLDKIQSLVRNTTTTSVIELTTARARYLEECIVSDLESVETLAGGLAHASQNEAENQARDFIATHGAAVAWVQFSNGRRWCSSDKTDLFATDLENTLFDPALKGETGSSPMYLGHNNEKRILFYAPVESTGPPSDGGVVPQAVYISFPADELQNSYGTTYTNAGETYVVDTTGTIVLDANHSASAASKGSLATMLAEAGNSSTEIDTLLEDIAAHREGDTVLMLAGEKQFVFFTPLTTKPGWSLITLLPLSVVESDGAQIVGLTSQMVGALAIAVVLAGAALVALSVYRNRRERERDRYVQSLYQAIGTNIDTAILIVDRESHAVEAVFENIERIMGIPARKFFVVDPLSSNEAYAKVAAVVHSAAEAADSCWEFQCDNPALGRTQWLRISSCDVLLGGEEKTIFSIFDATGDHAIRDQLSEAARIAEEANRAKSSFLSSMSHDIRTPMNAILGFSTLIDREAGDEAKVRDYNHKIATSGQHLLGLINDVLDMAKIESGKTTLASEAFVLSETAAAVEAMMRQQTDAKGQTFTVEVRHVTHDCLIGDEGRLRQILMNILSNAMKYTPEGGDILFRIDGSLKSHGALQHLRIIVRDNGIGMSPDYLRTIFDSFSREETAATSKIQGTGLGMAITKNLIDLMGAPSPSRARWDGAVCSSSISISPSLPRRRPSSLRAAPQPRTGATTRVRWLANTSSWPRTTT